MGASVRLHLWIKSDISRKLNSGNQLIYVALINSIECIYKLFSMPRCTYPPINYDGVTLHNFWHKVQCRGISVFFGTTVSVFPFCTQLCCQYIFFFEQWNQMFAVWSSSSSILFAIVRLKRVKYCMMLMWWCSLIDIYLY